MPAKTNQHSDVKELEGCTAYNWLSLESTIKVLIIIIIIITKKKKNNNNNNNNNKKKKKKKKKSNVNKNKNNCLMKSSLFGK